MKTRNYWQIRYTNVDTGNRITYMNIGFESENSAKNELRKIKEQIEKLKGLGAYLNRSENMQLNRACLIGKNFRIRKIKIKWK